MNPLQNYNPRGYPQYINPNHNQFSANGGHGGPVTPQERRFREQQLKLRQLQQRPCAPMPAMNSSLMQGQLGQNNYSVDPAQMPWPHDRTGYGCGCGCGGVGVSDTSVAREVGSSGQVIVDPAPVMPEAVPAARNAPSHAKRWGQDEHKMFLLGMSMINKGNKGNWRDISRFYVQTRSPSQVASHAQKYLMYKSRNPNEEGESSSSSSSLPSSQNRRRRRKVSIHSYVLTDEELEPQKVESFRQEYAKKHRLKLTELPPFDRQNV